MISLSNNTYISILLSATDYNYNSNQTVSNNCDK